MTFNNRFTIILFFSYIIIGCSEKTKNSEYYFTKGLENFTEEKYEESLIHYKKAIHLAENDSIKAASFNNYALSLEKLNQNDSAVFYYNKSLSILRNYYPALINYTNLALQSDKVRLEPSTLNYLKNYKDSTDAVKLLALYFQNQNRYDSAYAFYSLANETFSSNDSLWKNNYALVLVEIGKIEKAQNILLSITAKHPLFPEAMNNLGYTYLLNQSREKAATFFQSALQLNPDLKEARKNLVVLNALSASKTSRAALKSEKLGWLYPILQECEKKSDSCYSLLKTAPEYRSLRYYYYSNEDK